jgi:hypothetical protein
LNKYQEKFILPGGPKLNKYFLVYEFVIMFLLN